MAGLPHTGVLAFLYILFVVNPKDEEEEAQRKRKAKRNNSSESQAYTNA